MKIRSKDLCWNNEGNLLHYYSERYINFMTESFKLLLFEFNSYIINNIILDKIIFKRLLKDYCFLGVIERDYILYPSVLDIVSESNIRIIYSIYSNNYNDNIKDFFKILHIPVLENSIHYIFTLSDRWEISRDFSFDIYKREWVK